MHQIYYTIPQHKDFPETTNIKPNKVYQCTTLFYIFIEYTKRWYIVGQWRSDSDCPSVAQLDHEALRIIGIVTKQLQPVEQLSYWDDRNNPAFVYLDTQICKHYKHLIVDARVKRLVDSHKVEITLFQIHLYNHLANLPINNYEHEPPR